MSQRGRALRLFVAIYPPAPVVAALLALRRQAVDQGVRDTPEGQVHLTLHFIGPTIPIDLDRVAESVGAACAGLDAFSLRPLRLACLPPRGAPRLLAAETDAPPEVLEIHRRLAHRLARSPRPDAADRFLPHLTLCRYLPGGHGARVSAELHMEAFRVEEVRLMRSVLKSSGVEHSPLAAFELGN